MNWGKSITLSFVIFAAIILSMVVISMRQSVNLVAHNYYEEEIAYQDQIDRIENFNALARKPSITRDLDNLNIAFAEEMAVKLTEGKIQLYRPSNAEMDKKYKVTLNATGTQIIPIAGLPKGLWKVMLSWKSGEKEYFTSQTIVL